ncbi:unnamed protein product (macronuclear) [Paramecium tetraurelia]|uniref:Protein kinase domain-containing protein n=1 Tax=Paramecium tetraurelia TaxID=5888 RepID=A0DLM9_PARTE|nr:uncharacterized protein GSPATT00039578001 [Paramecium tetraurelia]CAK83946.1 unnamed protein product [Paramecium tetraurelia]|eukprot:XP_001451343.1 hypothetical protein (macronuclear) [Paramecium tetraurelia strain d4-2]
MDPQQLIDNLNDILLTDYFRYIEVLGRGSFGIVVAAYSQQLDKVVAIKITPYFEQENESSLLQESSHPNIVKLYKVLVAYNFIYLIMEKLVGTTLDVVLKEQTLDELQIRNIMLQVLNALAFIHRKGIIHRDLKPENIFISNGNHVKLIDLGLGYQIVCRGIIGQQVGTPYYIAPELINGCEQTQALDIFSLGVIFYQMLCNNKHPIWTQGQTKKDYYRTLSREFHITYPSHLSEMAQDFIKNTLTRSPIDRMTAEQCLEHPWLLGEDRKSHPITNKEIIQRYNFIQKFQLIVKALQMVKIFKQQCHEEMYYLKSQNSDEINEIFLNDDAPKTQRVYTDTHINIRHHQKTYYKPQSLKTIQLTKMTSSQDLVSTKNKMLNSNRCYNCPSRYKTSLDIQLPKVNSQKRIHLQLPSISPYQTRQSSFIFRQS